MSIKVKRGFWDFLGICVSGLCIVHCTILPLALVAYPTLSFLLPHEDHLHTSLIGFIIGIAVISFYLGYRQHRQIKPMLWMLVGLTIVTFSTFFATALLGPIPATIITLIGSGFLIRAHYMNYCSCKTCH